MNDDDDILVVSRLRGVFVGLFLRVPRRFGVHFGVVLASFWTFFLNKSTFENMCFVYTKPYFFRSGWVGCLNFFLRISSMLFKIYFLRVFGVLVTAQGQFWDPIGSLLGVSGPILASLWTSWSPLCSGVGIRCPKEQFWWSLEGFTRWFTRNHLVNVVWIAFTRILVNPLVDTFAGWGCSSEFIFDSSLHATHTSRIASLSRLRDRRPQ